MSFTHTIAQTYRNDAGSISAVTTVTVGPAEVNLDISVPASTTNAEHDIVFTFASVLACDLYASGALTVKTNSTSAPDDTFTLAALQAKTYASGTGGSGSAVGTNLFTANVTKFYVTNASSTTAATLKFRALLNI
jgi:hypothetical protein